MKGLPGDGRPRPPSGPASGRSRVAPARSRGRVGAGAAVVLLALLALSAALPAVLSPAASGAGGGSGGGGSGGGSGSGSRGSDPPLSVSVTFWPSTLCASPGAVVPVGLRVSGPANGSFEVSAWLYNGGQLGHVWAQAEESWRWAHYQSLTLNQSSAWSDYRFLQVRREPNWEKPYYLKAKVRNASTSVEVKLEEWELREVADCAVLSGYLGNGSAPYEGYRVQLRNGSGVVTANLTGPAPWTPEGEGEPGAYQLAAPPGDYTLEVLEPGDSGSGGSGGAPVASHNLTLNRPNLTFNLGWQPSEEPDPPDPEGPRPAGPAGHRLLLTELAPDTYLSGDPDEYIALHNPTDQDVNLTGWALAEDSATALFPLGAVIEAGRTLRVALNGSAYASAWGAPPDYELQPSSYRDAAGRPLPALNGTPLRLANSGEVVELRDATGAAIDTVVYGDTTYYGPGWEWPPLEAPSRGQVLVRWTTTDTNSSADWNGSWQTLKIGYSRWPLTVHPFTGGRAFVSPDSSFTALAGLMDEATVSLDINLYTFTSPWLALALANASARGVAVRLLLEGTPVGGLSDASLWAAHTVASAGGQVRLLAPDAPNGTSYRYLNDHAKYLIADGKTVAVMSENWNRRGVPFEPGYGNRGWGISLDSPELAAALTRVFQGDYDPDRADSVPWGWGDFKLPTGVKPNWTLEPQVYTPRFDPAEVADGNVTLLLSPDNLVGPGGLDDLLAGAAESIWVQQASLPIFWEGRPNPHLAAILEAARRGLQVRVLLDGGLIYSIQENSMTVDYLNGLAVREGLDLSARLFPGYPLVKAHNKGALIDGRYVLVGSTNWVRAAAMDNREVSLWLDSPEAAAYFGRVYDYDWKLAGGELTEGGGTDDDGWLSGLEVGMLLVVLVVLAAGVRRYRPA